MFPLLSPLGGLYCFPAADIELPELAINFIDFCANNLELVLAILYLLQPFDEVLMCCICGLLVFLKLWAYPNYLLMVNL